MTAKEIINRELLEKILPAGQQYASVYRHGNCDCTNGGESSKHDSVYVAIELDGYPEKINGKPVLYLRNNTREHCAFFPADSCNVAGNKWYMAGGNFAYTSDSRFVGLPISIHDRHEA